MRLSEDQISDAIAEMAAETPQATMVLLTGMFVGIVEYVVSQNGGDIKNEIKIDGNGSRDITIHAKKVTP